MLRDPKMVYLFLYVNDLDASRVFFEDKLGLRVIEEDSGAVKYDVGGTILALNRAKDFSMEVGGRPDDTSIIVFHVDDIDAMRSSLEARGVEFSGPTDRYDIGATATFYSPDGHCFGLYEPSEESLRWPSGDKIRAVLALNPSGDGSTAPSEKSSDELTLGSRRLLYLFLFVRDVEKTAQFYAKTLGLRVLEESPEAGVAKYDAGDLILATHLVASEEGARANPEDLDRPRAIAPVFYTPDIKSSYEKLSKKGVRFTSGLSQSGIGSTTKFEDPSGHVFYLYEPSEESLTWSSGPKIKQMIARTSD